MFFVHTLALAVSAGLQAGCAVGLDYNRYGNSYKTDLNARREIDVFGGLRRGCQAVTSSAVKRASSGSKESTQVMSTTAATGMTVL